MPPIISLGTVALFRADCGLTRTVTTCLVLPLLPELVSLASLEVAEDRGWPIRGDEATHSEAEGITFSKSATT